MGKFILTSEYKPTGDQPEAIRELTEGLDRGDRAQVLLGVTGSGKTFTMANVIAQHNRPTLILSHNKTLAHQLYMEMKEFFPQNAVEYSRRNSVSTTRSTDSGSLLYPICFQAEMMSSSSLLFPASMVWVVQSPYRRTS